MLKLGVHVAKKSKVIGEDNEKKRKTRKTMLEAIQDDLDTLNSDGKSGNSCCLTCVQIYTHGPRNSKKNSIDLDAVRGYIEENSITLIVHSPHVTPGPLWKITRAKIQKVIPSDNKVVAGVKEKSRFAVINFIDQLKTAKTIGASHLVVHLPDMPLVEMTPALKIILHYVIKFNMPVVFENVPVSDSVNEVSSAEAINAICRGFLEAVPGSAEHWGLCIDTAHIWSCGVNLSKRSDQNKWFKALSPEAIAQIKLIHLNGSKNSTFNKSRDIHYIAMSDDDDMYPSSVAPSKLGISGIIEFAKRHGIPVICEINRGTETEVRDSLGKIGKI